MTRLQQLSLLFIAPMTLGLSGCGALYPEQHVELQHTPVVQLPPLPTTAPSNGAIYQAASYRPLFEDHRARLVGDTLTIQIVEKVSASQSSTSSIDKSGTLAAGSAPFPWSARRLCARHRSRQFGHQGGRQGGQCKHQ